MVEAPQHSESEGTSAPGEAWAEAIQREHWRRMAPLEKARYVSALCRSAHRVAMLGLAARHPQAGAEELRWRLAVLRYGRETLERIVGRPLPFTVDLR